MKHEKIKLPYDEKALAPIITEETISFHYGKHHQKYVDTLNTLIEGTEFEDKSLIDIIKTSDGPIFNNAAQVFNHNFYWLGLTSGDASPSLELSDLIDKSFGSLEGLKEQFIAFATKNFGSGWTWLVLKDGKLEIINTSNAATPVSDGIVPLLTCDVWEHAYYIDYRNARPEYLSKWWGIVNWNFVSINLAEALHNVDGYFDSLNYVGEDYLGKFDG